MIKQLARQMGFLALYRRLRYGKKLPVKPGVGYPWTGNYQDWESARAAAGDYSNPGILARVLPATLAVKNGEAVYERDSVLFEKAEYPEALVKALLTAAAELDGNLQVVDFGGSLGSTYFQTRSYLSSLTRLTWSVVEQPHFVAAGNQYISDGCLRFYDTIAATAAPRASLILLSGVLQCLPDPYTFLKEEVLGRFEYILIDRTGFIAGSPARITVQRVPKEIFDASYPAWFFREEEFVEAFAGQYQQLSGFRSFADPDLQSDDGKKLYWKGFFFKLKHSSP